MTIEENIYKVCDHNKYGFCKYGAKCRQKHVDTKCENPMCEIKTCLKRHPKECRFYRSYGRCKFGTFCLYEHIDVKANQKSEIESLKNSLRVLESRFDKISEETKDAEKRETEEAYFRKELDIMKAETKAVKDILDENRTEIDNVVKDMREKFDTKLDIIKKEFVKLKEDIMAASPVSSPCCEFRCCSGTYSPASGCPGPGHHKLPGDKSICCNHKTKM